ncbi:gluconokinase [Nitrincola alkalilacustris]|uniref:gluconokinase n=1 Tax=Nitrincola alkalilacustris TaxID=1571224 RepID=UPI00124E1C0D|nr:gluconokinase [Nitrincola alkalilacustris]
MIKTNIVVMGVCGSGKSTLAEHLATRLGGVFLEGDRYHSPENVRKMTAGTPLNDQDRIPWLQTLAEQIQQHTQKDQQCILACSSLKRIYRDQLRKQAGDLLFIYLQGDEATLRNRMQSRQGHYMNIALLQTQLNDLEEPGPEERCLTLSINQSIDEMLTSILQWLQNQHTTLTPGMSVESFTERSGADQHKGKP